MISLAWPWVFLLLPLPILVRHFIKPAQQELEAALKVPFIDDFSLAVGGGLSRSNTPWKFWLALLAWLLLVTATARPQWLGDPIEIPISGRDLMLAVDLSGSMEEKDFEVRGVQVSRLAAIKWVAGDFIERRKGDRIGLILFGERAYLQTPLTFDRRTIQILLDEAVIGLAGTSTAIGDAIGLTIKRLKDKGFENRVLILLTDGANTAGETAPLKAAKLAAKHGLKIYTIGIGADRMMVRSLFGNRMVNPSRDLDEKSLKAIASSTGGRYFRARNTAELHEIYAELDRLQPVEQESQTFRPTEPLYPWPLAAAMIIAYMVLWRRQA